MIAVRGLQVRVIIAGCLTRVQIGDVKSFNA
jgi:hypothetical protein